MTDEPVRKARTLAERLQERGHHAEAEAVRRALHGPGVGEALLHALRDACQTVLTAIEAIDPVSATAVEELRLEVDARLLPSHPHGAEPQA